MLSAIDNYKIKSNELGNDKILERDIMWRKANLLPDGLYKIQAVKDVVEKLVSTVKLKCLLFFN